MRVKEGMSLRNGMLHGLRNEIIMRNVNEAGKHAHVFARLFLAPIWVSNCCAGPFITAGSQTNKAKQTVAISFTAFVSM